jgi:hypothetical protein
MKKIALLAIFMVLAVLTVGLAPSQSFAGGYGGAAASGAGAAGDAVLDGLIDAAFKSIFKKPPKKEQNKLSLEQIKDAIEKQGAKDKRNVIVLSFHEVNVINENAYLVTFRSYVNRDEMLVSLLFTKVSEDLYQAKLCVYWNDMDYNSTTKKYLAGLLVKAGINIGEAENVPIGMIAFKATQPTHTSAPTSEAGTSQVSASSPAPVSGQGKVNSK